MSRLRRSDSLTLPFSNFDTPLDDIELPSKLRCCKLPLDSVVNICLVEDDACPMAILFTASPGDSMASPRDQDLDVEDPVVLPHGFSKEDLGPVLTVLYRDKARHMSSSILGHPDIVIDLRPFRFCIIVERM
jgi:hypothetical protein